MLICHVVITVCACTFVTCTLIKINQSVIGYAKCVRGWLLSCLNMPLVCVCHECAVCAHTALMTDTHKSDMYTTEQNCKANTLTIDMTHTCDTSHTQCVFEVSQVGVMTMLSVCVSLLSCLNIPLVCLSWVCCVWHTLHTHDRHTQAIYSHNRTVLPSTHS